jgi:biopolymer transport protein ExbD
MRRRTRYANEKPPEINLVPMLDVLMTVLTFFIILSMVLGSQSTVEVGIPAQGEDANAPDRSPPPPPLLIELDRTGNPSVIGRSIPIAQLKADVQNYLKNPKGVVLIQPNPDLPYEKVLQLIGDLREIGQDRITLAVGEDVSKAALTPKTGGDGTAAEAEAPADQATDQAPDQSKAEASQPEADASSEPPAETTSADEDTGDGPGLD